MSWAADRDAHGERLPISSDDFGVSSAADPTLMDIVPPVEPTPLMLHCRQLTRRGRLPNPTGTQTQRLGHLAARHPVTARPVPLERYMLHLSQVQGVSGVLRRLVEHAKAHEPRDAELVHTEDLGGLCGRDAPRLVSHQVLPRRAGAPPPSEMLPGENPPTFGLRLPRSVAAYRRIHEAVE